MNFRVCRNIRRVIDAVMFVVLLACCYFAFFYYDMLPETLVCVGCVWAFCMSMVAIVIMAKAGEREDEARAPGSMMSKFDVVYVDDDMAADRDEDGGYEDEDDETDCTMAFCRRGVLLDDGTRMTTLYYQYVQSMKADPFELYIDYGGERHHFCFRTVAKAREAADILRVRCHFV